MLGENLILECFMRDAEGISWKEWRKVDYGKTKKALFRFLRALKVFILIFCEI
jgi:hypothetical protein